MSHCTSSSVKLPASDQPISSDVLKVLKHRKDNWSIYFLLGLPPDAFSRQLKAMTIYLKALYEKGVLGDRERDFLNNQNLIELEQWNPPAFKEWTKQTFTHHKTANPLVSAAAEESRQHYYV